MGFRKCWGSMCNDVNHGYVRTAVADAVVAVSWCRKKGLLKLDVISFRVQRPVIRFREGWGSVKVIGVKGLGFKQRESVPTGTKPPETTLPSSVP